MSYLKLRPSEIKGTSFGLVSGVITTLGLMAGLAEGTGSKLTVMLGVITIAFADAFSDALGMHISEETKEKSNTSIWRSTIATYVSKLSFTLTFAIPLIVLDLTPAVIVSVIYGLGLIGLISYFIAKIQNKNKIAVIAEHVIITLGVILLSHTLGDFFKGLANA